MSSEALGISRAPSTDIDMVDAESEYSHVSGTTTGETNAHSSSLLRLPLELRQRIWFCCLHNSENPVSWPSRTKSAENIATSLLRTCHSIYDEAAPILYQSNVLNFRHPSDANMFLYSHNTQLGKHTRRMLVHIVDRDLPLWMAYFNSNNHIRSLTHDYPALQELLIVLRSSPSLIQTGHDLVQAYRRWQTSSSLQNLCGSLKTMTEAGLKAKVIFARLASQGDCQALLEEFPDEFDPHPKDAPGPRARTKWVKLFGAQIALDATAPHNPWLTTGNLF